MAEIKLKPCPFCGGPAEVTQCGREWYVECAQKRPVECYCKPWTGYCDTKLDAIEIWNRRPKDET